LRIDDAGWYAQMRSNVLLCLHVYILCAVESRRTAGADAVGAEGLNGFLFESLVRNEVVEIERGEVCDGAAVGELRLGSCRSAPVSALRRTSSLRTNSPYNDWPLLVIELFGRSRRSDKWLWCPILHKFVYLLFSSQQTCPRLAVSRALHTASVRCTFFCVLYLGASRYLTAKRNRKSSTALLTGSFW
jgi:hypothetical protein